MKKLLVLFVALSAFTFTSCSDDDKNPQSNENSILGKWYLYSFKDEGELEIEKYECENKDYYDFKSNGKVDFVTFDQDCKKDIEEGTYSLKDNILKTSLENNRPYTCTIKNDEMILVNKEKEETLVFKRLK